jgi:DNA-binding NtrC family response regulator
MSVIMRTLEDDMALALESNASVMISGEKGSGRTFVARTIHRRSRRVGAPFYIVHGRDMSDMAVDSGPAPARPRLFEEASPHVVGDGTLVIDDIQTMPLTLQDRLMQFIDTERTAGSDRRLMTLANRDVFSSVRSGQFRSDLFYRLNIIHLVIPALREQPEDIPLLFHHYLSSYASTRVPRLSDAAIQQLVAYPWPGNVHELHTVARTLAERNLERPLEAEDLPPLDPASRLVSDAARRWQ